MTYTLILLVGAPVSAGDDVVATTDTAPDVTQLVQGPQKPDPIEHTAKAVDSIHTALSRLLETECAVDPGGAACAWLAAMKSAEELEKGKTPTEEKVVEVESPVRKDG